MVMMKTPNNEPQQTSRDEQGRRNRVVAASESERITERTETHESRVTITLALLLFRRLRKCLRSLRLPCNIRSCETLALCLISKRIDHRLQLIGWQLSGTRIGKKGGHDRRMQVVLNAGRCLSRRCARRRRIRCGVRGLRSSGSLRILRFAGLSMNLSAGRSRRSRLCRHCGLSLT